MKRNSICEVFTARFHILSDCLCLLVTLIFIELMHNLCHCFDSYLPTECGYCKLISCVCPGVFFMLWF